MQHQDFGNAEELGRSNNDLRLPALSHSENIEQGRDWDKFFQSLSDPELEGVALLRVIECTNGCIQHALREKIPQALSIEQTREAMNLSMGLMKTMEFDIGNIHYSFSPNAQDGLREIRDLYKSAFKKQDAAALEEFMSASVACASALGTQKIEWAAGVVKEHLSAVYPSHTVGWGVRYLTGLLS